MSISRAVALAGAVCLATTAQSADEALVKNARSAGPESISADATIMNWDLKVVLEGTNGWTCLPDRPDTEGNDPWCVNEPWLNFLKAYVTKTEPSYTKIGFAYMLMGDSPVSNKDPYATEKTTDDDWVVDLHAHLMMLIPNNEEQFKHISKDAYNGGPWIMWPDTPYAHIMIPIDSYGGKEHKAKH